MTGVVALVVVLAVCVWLTSIMFPDRGWASGLVTLLVTTAWIAAVAYVVVLVTS